MNLTKSVLAAVLLLLGASLASASVLPSSGLPALWFQNVPEPSSLVVLGCALVGVLGIARRKNKS